MAYDIVDSGGRVLLGTTAGASNTFDGLGMSDCELAEDAQTIEAIAMEDTEPQVDVTSTNWQVTGTFFAEDDGSRTPPAVGTKLYVTYKSQEGTTLKSGYGIVTSRRNTQRKGGYETWQLTIRPTREPA